MLDVILFVSQIHGELDTRLGVPTFGRAVVRRFYPDVSKFSKIQVVSA